jgi:hypothetical protein
MIPEGYLSGLERVKETRYPAYCSRGAAERALKLSKIAEKGYAYLNEFIKADYEIPLLVLNQEDWRRYFKDPYGMMVGDNGCIHFPADEEPPTIDVAEPLYTNSPESLRIKLSSAVRIGGDPFREAMKIYRDTIVVHELTHVFLYNTDNVLRSRPKDEPEVFGLPWFNEFFCQYTTYAFLRRHVDEYGYELRIVELLLEVLYRGGLSIVKHTMDDLNRLYTGVGMRDYQWFMFRNMLGARELYEVYGEAFIGYALKAFEPSNGFLVLNLEASQGGLGGWFRDWLEKGR